MNEAELYQHLIDHTNLSLEEIKSTIESKQYKRYHIKQGNKYRQIEEPCLQLANIQRALLPILEQYPLLPCCIGGRRGYSTSLNIVAHGEAKHLLKIDISRCYQSIRPYHLKTALNKYAELKDIEDAILAIGMIDSFLPTGAPTSPMLCNIALSLIDEAVDNKVKEIGHTYTRYLDDMVISTRNDNKEWTLKHDIFCLLKSYGLYPNKKKSKWLSLENDKALITGINIGHHVGVPRVVKRELRSKLHHLATEKKPLDLETKGLLSYISGIDPTAYQDILSYWQERCKRYESPE